MRKTRCVPGYIRAVPDLDMWQDVGHLVLDKHLQLLHRDVDLEVSQVQATWEGDAAHLVV